MTTSAPATAKAFGDGPADAPAASGDDGDLAGEIEQFRWRFHGTFLPTGRPRSWQRHRFTAKA